MNQYLSWIYWFSESSPDVKNPEYTNVVVYKPSPEPQTILWNSISSLGSGISDYQNNIFNSEPESVNLGTVTTGEKQIFNLGTAEDNQIVNVGTAEVNQIVNLGTAEENQIVNPGTAQENQIVNHETSEEIKSDIPERMTTESNLIFDTEAGVSDEDEKPFVSPENDQLNYGIQSEENIPEYQPIYQLIFQENLKPGKHTTDPSSESNGLKTSSQVVDDSHKHLPIHNIPANSKHEEPNLLLSSDQLYPHNHLDHESSNNGFILMGRFLFKMFIKYFEF